MLSERHLPHTAPENPQVCQNTLCFSFMIGTLYYPRHVEASLDRNKFGTSMPVAGEPHSPVKLKRSSSTTMHPFTHIYSSALPSVPPRTNEHPDQQNHLHFASRFSSLIGVLGYQHGTHFSSRLLFHPSCFSLSSIPSHFFSFTTRIKTHHVSCVSTPPASSSFVRPC